MRSFSRRALAARKTLAVVAVTALAAGGFAFGGTELAGAGSGPAADGGSVICVNGYTVDTSDSQVASVTCDQPTTTTTAPATTTTTAPATTTTTAPPPPTTIAGTDLVVDSVSYTPTSPTVGQAVTFTATITNQGNTATGAGLWNGVGFYAGTNPAAGVNELSWGNTPHTIAAGATVTISSTNVGGPSWAAGQWTPTAAGTQTVTAWVNDTHAVTESNFANDQLTFTVNVGAGSTTTTTAPSGGTSTCSSPYTVSVFCSAGPVSVLPSSSAMVADVVNSFNLYGAFVDTANLYVVPAGQSMATVAGGWGSEQVPVPSNAAPSGGTDADAFFYSPSLDEEWEFWQFSGSYPNYTASAEAHQTGLESASGVFATSSGVAASHISYLATMITASDVTAGAINHAIPLVMQYCGGGYVAPANRAESNCQTGGGPEMGQWFRFPASVNCGAYSGFAGLVCEAVQTYGMVVTDYAGGGGTVAQSGITTGSIAGLPWSSLQATTPPPAA